MAVSVPLKNLLMPLLHAPGTAAPELEDSDSYMLTLSDTLSLEISESPQEFVTITCLLAIPEARYEDWETLAILLQTNLLGLEHPAIITGLLIEQKKVILWTRQPFVIMDTQAMKQLVERIAIQAEKVQGWLVSPLAGQ